MIGFAGMTHLGIVSSIAAAAKGHQVIGFHDNAGLISELSRGAFPIREPRLAELYQRNVAGIAFTEDIGALSECEIVYVSIDIATNEVGESDLGPIRTIIGQVSSVLRSDSCLVILSQVPPGFTRRVSLDRRRLFYQVETLIFGRAVERAMQPERIILGCDDPNAPVPHQLANFLGAFNCPVLRMRYESAELAKISINVCLVAAISAANTMAEICEKIGADWAEIVPALRLDRRIGQHSYIQPGLGISGGNLERDLQSVLRLSREFGTDGGVIASWMNNSQRRKCWPLDVLRREVLERNLSPTIAVLGLAYKENTHSTKNSPALLLIRELSGCRIRVYDPAIDACAVSGTVTGAPSALQAAEGADAVAIMTPWPEFRGIMPENLATVMRGRTIVDPYGMLDGQKARSAGLAHFTLGRPPG